jgi:hypothetical protein
VGPVDEDGAAVAGEAKRFKPPGPRYPFKTLLDSLPIEGGETGSPKGLTSDQRGTGVVHLVFPGKREMKGVKPLVRPTLELVSVQSEKPVAERVGGIGNGDKMSADGFRNLSQHTPGSRELRGDHRRAARAKDPCLFPGDRFDGVT